MNLPDEFDVLSDREFEAMSPEQVVLYLARGGVSPLDCEAALKRVMELFDPAIEAQEKN